MLLLLQNNKEQQTLPEVRKEPFSHLAFPFYLPPSIGKDSDAERDWGQEKKGMTEDEMAGWHH